MINKFLEVLGRNLEIISNDLKVFVLLNGIFLIIAALCYGVAKLASKIKNLKLCILFMYLSSVVLGLLWKVIIQTILN